MSARLVALRNTGQQGKQGMNTHDREVLAGLVLRMQRVLQGEAVGKVSSRETLRVLPQLESLLKSVLDITDVEVIIDTELDALTE